jgi:hypothetical protein
MERIARMRFVNKIPLAALPVTTNAPAATNAAPATRVEAGGVVVAEAQAVAAQMVINGAMIANAPVMISSRSRRSGAKTTPEPVTPMIAYPAGSTRCFFNDQEAVTLKIDKLADETLTGVAEGIGALKLPLGAFSRLEFNPGAKRDAGGDDDEL